MDFPEALTYMQGLRRFGIKLGNERFEALLRRLGNPHQGYGIAHVAGTKGKGSTTAMIAAILRAHGFRVGGYYSPYVYDVRERVQVDGEMIPPDEFASLVTEIAPHVEALKQTPYGDTTEFELKTAVGFRYFADRQVDYAAIEVGIGGRLDATNVVTPLVSVITNIGLDHTHILGDTHAKIAREKAGIIKPGVPCVTATEEPSALAVIEEVAADRGATLIQVSEGAPRTTPGTHEIRWSGGDMLTIQTASRTYDGLRLRLRGSWQWVNAACAVGAVEAIAQDKGFEVNEEAIREGLAKAYLPGRMEVVQERPTVVMDGAHNAMAAEALAGEVRRFAYRSLLLVVGVATGHDPRGILAALGPLADRVFATQPTWIKGLPAAEIAAIARDYCASVETITPPIAAARAALSEAGPEDLVLITGSFYVVGDVHPGDLIGGASPTQS
jgi:dihydrofolate synthase / folylpolyglutamate synthase